MSVKLSNCLMVKGIGIICVLLLLIATSSVASAYDVNEKLSINGTLTGVYQYGDYDVKGMDNKNGGAFVLDLGTNFHPTDRDEFQLTLSFAAGNGLNQNNPFSLTPYADDLEDDLKNINGRNRDYLLLAWYKHTFKFNENTSLALTGGIIDATVYIDDNAFANCETSQFMNQIFVNHKNVNLPSYDIGGAAELNISNLSIRGVIMNTKYEAAEEDFKNYNYYALQIGYALDTALGKGNYRVYGFTTSKRFQDWDDRGEDSLKGIGISLDQQLSSVVGVFARAGWQDDAVVIDHQNAYSGGVNINGKLWGREKDEIGVGYAYLTGADKSDIDNTNAIESYIKFQISKFSDVSLDIQYIDDNLRHEDNRKGFIYGVRANAYF
jgi:Carbohydrate-selective porin, OprB family